MIMNNKNNTSLFDEAAINFGFRELGNYAHGESMRQLYSQLIKSLRVLYNEPIDAVFAFEDPNNKKQMWRADAFDYSSMNLSWREAMIALQAVYADRPLLFFSDIYKTGGNPNNGIIIPLIDAECSQGKIRRFYTDIIENEIRENTAQVDLNRKKRDVAREFYEIIRKRTRYDNNKGNANYTRYVDIASHSILNYVRNKSAVCQGYARTYQAFMNYVGIPVVSTSVIANGGLHAINLVYLEDESKWIMIDVSAGLFDVKPGTYRQLCDKDKTTEFHKNEPLYKDIWASYANKK